MHAFTSITLDNSNALLSGLPRRRISNLQLQQDNQGARTRQTHLKISGLEGIVCVFISFLSLWFLNMEKNM